jgi:hypothetical protein
MRNGPAKPDFDGMVWRDAKRPGDIRWPYRDQLWQDRRDEMASHVIVFGRAPLRPLPPFGHAWHTVDCSSAQQPSRLRERRLTKGADKILLGESGAANPRLRLLLRCGGGPARDWKIPLAQQNAGDRGMRAQNEATLRLKRPFSLHG